jgi:BirA family biotin operon repressor/biotin-[acetyl-CoA-carboxylase] ligase
MSPHESLRGDELRTALSDSFIGDEVVVLEKTTSTNDAVWRMAQEGRAAGLVVFAERQTAGRGQRGNRWESGPYLGLWFSILLRPLIEPAESARLTTWAAKGIARTIEEQTGITAQIKLPNDICIAQRKIAGVLVEMRVEKNAGYAAIVGIGLNANHAITDFPVELRATAGSLAMAAGRPIDRQALAVALLRNLNCIYAELFAE